MVKKTILMILLASAILVGAPLTSQEPDVTPTVIVVESAPAVVEVGEGEAAVIAPVPSQVPETVAEDVAAQATTDLRNFAKGEINAAELTRDPAKTVDMGEGWEFTILGMMFALGVAPLIAWWVERSKMNSKLALGVAFWATVGFYYLGYVLLHSSSPHLPQHPLAWIATGLVGAFAGIALKSGTIGTANNGGGK